MRGAAHINHARASHLWSVSVSCVCLFVRIRLRVYTMNRMCYRALTQGKKKPERILQCTHIRHCILLREIVD